MANVKRGKSTTRFPKGRWEVRWRTPDGKHRTKTFDLRDDADRFAARVETRLADGDYIDREASSTPYATVVEEWLSTVVHLKPRTVAGYRAIAADRLVPRFGELPVSALSKSAIRSYLAEMAAEGRAAQTIRNVFFALRSSLHIAVENGYLRSNPCDGIRLPSSAHSGAEMTFLDPAGIERLAEELPEPYPVLIRFAAYTGLRAGEIAALTVADLDLLRCKLHVHASVSTVGRNSQTHRSTTKTGRSRVLPIPKFLADLLAAYLAANPRAHTSPLFDLPEGHNSWYTKVFNPAKRRAGFPTLRFHDLRHTAASLMIDSGANVKTVADFLGHSTVSQTLNRYAHRFATQDAIVTEGLERAYRSATG